MRGPLRTSLIFVALVGAMGPVGARSASACSCAGLQVPIEDAAGRANAVLLARIVRLSPPEDIGPYNQPMGSPYLEATVLESVRGPAKGRTIRVWDRDFGTSCGGGLQGYPVGSLVAMALVKNTPERIKTQRLNIGLDDYLAGGPCSERIRVLSSEEEGRALVSRLRKQGSSSK